MQKHAQLPILIFLHGLLGTGSDWQQTINLLPNHLCLSLDLPLHGKNKSYVVQDFEQTCAFLSERIYQHIGNRPYYLIGYSLGGRIALYYALHAQVAKGNLCGLILEGANLGLKTELERQVRWRNDLYWAQRFQRETPQRVLNDWYQQAVFADLNPQQRADLIVKRSEHCGENIAKMLLATSLAKQPNFALQLQQAMLPIHYIVGERDQKFRKIAQENGLNFSVIVDAGHNAHLENPYQVAEVIKKVVYKECVLNRGCFYHRI